MRPDRSISGAARLAPAALLVPLAILSHGPSPAARPGDLYVANIRNSTVTVYDGASGRYRGVFVEAGAGGLSGATGLAFGPDGNLYVGSSQTNTVLRYDGETGAFLDVFVSDSALEMPFSLIFGPDDHLYVSSGAKHVVLRYDGATGDYLGVAAQGDGLQQPIGLRFGPDGSLYVVNSVGKRVMRFDPATGESLGTFASDSLRFPADLVFGPDGMLYVTSAAGGSIVRFDERGTFVDIFARLPEGAAPVGIDVRADGQLFVADFARNRLFLVDPTSGSAEVVADSGLAGPENITVR